jgi:hypothetical protein
MGRLPPQTPPEKFVGTLLYFWATLCSTFSHATLVPLLCQKCGSLSAELGKLTEVLEIVDNSMQ